MSFAENLREKLHALRQASANGIGFTESDIWSSWPIDDAPFEHLLSLVGPDDAGIYIGTQLRIVAPLSFSIAGQKMTVFRTWPEIRKYLQDRCLFPLPQKETMQGAASTYSVRGCKFFFKAKEGYAVSTEVLDDIAECIDLVRRGSLIIDNMRKDVRHQRDRYVKSEIAQNENQFTVLQFFQFLTRTIPLHGALLFLSSIRRLSIDSELSSTEATNFIIDGLQIPLKYGQPYVDLLPGDSELLSLIMACARWGKPLFAKLPHRPDTALLLAPIRKMSSPGLEFSNLAFRSSIERTPETTLLASVIVAFVGPAISKHLIDEVTDYVDSFAEYRFSSRRLSLLLDINKRLNSTRISSTPRDALSRREMLDHFRAFAAPYLETALHTTSAHSVSVRVFDLSEKGLRRITSISSDTGTSIPKDVAQVIPVNDLWSAQFESVVAFTFARGAIVREGYVYIKNIRSPIPSKYRKLGLKKSLNVRPATRSEICFPLVVGATPVGTLNLEAPFPAGFDSDTVYLLMLKEGLEGYLEALQARVDLPWLLAHSNRTDSVHELRQHIETGKVFNDHQAALLRRLFPEPVAPPKNEWYELHTIRNYVDQWIDRTYTPTWSETTKKDFKRVLVIDSKLPRKTSIDPVFFSGLLTILRNILQNVVKHGEFNDRVIISTRLMGDSVECSLAQDSASHLQANGYIRIVYHSYGHRIDPNIVDQLGYRPTGGQEGNPRYGMFLIGMIARLLGGTVYAANSKVRGGLSLQVDLPMPQITFDISGAK